MKSTVLLALALFAATFAIYLPTISYEFLRIDDPDYILENRHIEHGLMPETVKWAFTDVGYASNWHPLAWISHALDVSIARTLGIIGESPADNARAWIRSDSKAASIMHMHNVLLHASNAGLLFILAIMLGKCATHEDSYRRGLGQEHGGICGNISLCVAFFSVLIWAIHPLRCEVVCWISERKELLSVFWMLLSLIFWLLSNNRQNPLPFHVVSIVFFALALLSKPVAVTLPAVIIACDWILLKTPFRKALVHAVPYAALSACACCITLAAQTEALEFGRQTSWPMRIECALEAPIIYMKQTLFPSGLSPVYLRGLDTDWPMSIMGGMLLGFMFWVCVRWFSTRGKKSGILAFIVSWSYVGLIPMIGLVKVGGQAHSDRYTYWIGCGVAVGAAIVAKMMVEGIGRHYVKKFAVILLCISAALCFLTLERSRYWRSTLSLYRDTVAKSYDAEIAFELADELVRQGSGVSLNEAETMLRETVSANPDPKAYAALAYFLAFHSRGQSMLTDPGAGAFQEARSFAQRALAENPKCWIAHAALAACNARDRRWADAVWHGELAIDLGLADGNFAELISDCRKNAAQKQNSKGDR